ncbi:MAG: DMT family transporter [Geminicoccaceae bacterium]|nr:DMT family transporter [Geminicoccaceae bacterium]
MEITRPAPLAAGSLLPAILLLLGAVSVIPVMDGIAKILAWTYPVVQVTWGRYFFNLLFILPFVLWRYGPGALSVPHRPLQILRGLFLVVSTFFFFLTLSFLPVADTLALVFLYPLLVTLASPFFLGERVGWRRLMAVAVGFAGALLIIRPGTSMFQPAAFWGCLAGATVAGYLVLTRRLAGTAPAPVSLAFAALVGAVALSLIVPFSWRPPTAGDWLLMLSMGAIAALCHLGFIMAYERAPASILAPLGYAEMPSAVLVGFLFFGDLPDGWTWAGIVVIVGSGLFVVWREKRAASGTA